MSLGTIYLFVFGNSETSLVSRISPYHFQKCQVQISKNEMEKWGQVASPLRKKKSDKGGVTIGARQISVALAVTPPKSVLCRFSAGLRRSAWRIKSFGKRSIELKPKCQMSRLDPIYRLLPSLPELDDFPMPAFVEADAKPSEPAALCYRSVPV